MAFYNDEIKTLQGILDRSAEETAKSLGAIQMNEPTGKNTLGMNPWEPISNPLTLKHLGKLGEECGELSSAVSRCIIQGIRATEPTSGKPNDVWLMEEIADVLANINLVVAHLGLSNHFISVRKTEKMAKLRAWHQMLPNESKTAAPVAHVSIVPIPIPMVLYCPDPDCGAQHIDRPHHWSDLYDGPGDDLSPAEKEIRDARIAAYEAAWTNPPHKSHLCGTCGTIWRPCDYPTVGVEKINTAGKADSPRPR
jgi:hypothetical protein